MEENEEDFCKKCGTFGIIYGNGLCKLCYDDSIDDLNNLSNDEDSICEFHDEQNCLNQENNPVAPFPNQQLNNPNLNNQNLNNPQNINYQQNQMTNQFNQMNINNPNQNEQKKKKKKKKKQKKK